MWRKLIARYLLLARAILPLLRHTRGAARGRRKSPRRLLGPGSAAFSPFYCAKTRTGNGRLSGRPGSCPRRPLVDGALLVAVLVVGLGDETQARETLEGIIQQASRFYTYWEK